MLCEKTNTQLLLGGLEEDQPLPASEPPSEKTGSSVGGRRPINPIRESRSAEGKAYYAKNREAVLARQKIARKLKPEIYNKKRDRTEYYKREYAKNSEEHKERSKEWYHANKDRAKATRVSRRDVLKIWYKNYNIKNRESLNERSKKWQKENRARVNASFRKRYNASENLRIAARLRTRIRGALKRQNANKCATSIELLGCSIAQARLIIESRMVPPMTWLDFMEGRIHLDHKRPVCSFDLRDPKQQAACFSINNLFPLWRRDNLSKGSKFPCEP